MKCNGRLHNAFKRVFLNNEAWEKDFMAELRRVYRCNVCGNIVEVLHSGVGELVCCEQPMELLKEKTRDAGLEKHVPVIERTSSGIKVKIGSVPHPMEENHYIEWVEVLTDNEVHRRFFKPEDKPEVEFPIREEKIQVKEYCNVHGLWKTP